MTIHLSVLLAQTLFLEVWLNGAVEHVAPVGVLAAGMAGTVVSGVVGGWLAAWIGGRRPWPHALAVLIPLMLDTTYVIVNDVGGEPVWFSLGGSLTLMAATLAGGALRVVQGQRRRGPAGAIP